MPGMVSVKIFRRNERVLRTQVVLTVFDLNKEKEWHSSQVCAYFC